MEGMWAFVRWQRFLWRYREQLHRAFMEDDSSARRFVHAKAAEWRVTRLVADADSGPVPPHSDQQRRRRQR